MPKVADDFDKTIYNHTKIMKFLTNLLKSKPTMSSIIEVEKAAEELTQTNYKLMSKIDKLEKDY